MIRALIVDDESKTRMGLAKYIEWNRLGVDIIQLAGSAEEALDMCEEFEPEIVLSDIRMRGMTGVEMCRIIHEKYPKCLMIFISGFSDKEYLKAAIELGVVQYIEKPVDRDELEAAVKKMVRIIRESRASKIEETRSRATINREAFLQLLEKPHEKTDYGELLNRAGIDVSKGSCFRVCILHAEAAVVNLVSIKEFIGGYIPEKKENISYYFELIGSRRVAIIIQGDKNVADENSGVMCGLFKITEMPEFRGFFIAVGKAVCNASDIHESMQYAKEVEETLFFKGYGVTTAEKKPEGDFDVDKEPYVNEIKEALRAGKTQNALDVLDRMSQTYIENTVTKSGYIKSYYYTLWYTIAKEYVKIYPKARENIVKSYESDSMQIEEIDTIEGLRAFLSEKLEVFEKESSRDQSNNAIVAKVKQIIEMEYGRSELSVKELAEDVYLTPTYLSTLFKQKTGRTIGNYLTEIRVEHAKELLQDKQLKLYNVSEQVGYGDPNYFAKIFKKSEGVTPSEYREQIL